MKICALIVVVNLFCGTIYSQEFKSYTNEKNRFSISYPRAWKKDVTNKKHLFTFSTHPSGSGIVIIPSVGVNLSIRKTNDCTLDTIFYRHMKHLHVYHGEKITEGGESMVNGRNFYWFETLAENKYESSKRKHYMTIRDDKIITLTFKAKSRTDFLKFEPTFLTILNSLIILD